MAIPRPVLGPNQLKHELEAVWDYLDALGAGLGHWYDVTAHGLVGDGTTDNTNALQDLIDLVSGLGLDATLFFPAGIYVIAGALQDTSLSSSQIVLPKINKSTPMRTLRFLGESPAAQAWPTVSGSILKSTLASGSGSIIGVRCNWGSDTSHYITEAQNNMTFLTFVVENMTVRAIANPTISGVDQRFIHRAVIRHSRIDVEGITTGPLSVTPDVSCTEPTTATSYGLLTPIDGIPSLALYEDVTIMGYYNLMRWGELINANNITFGGGKVAMEIRGGSHISCAQKLLVVSCAVHMKTLGRDPLFTNTGAPNENYLNVQQYDYENSSATMAWAATTTHIHDANNYLVGDLNWSSTAYPLIVNGCKNLVLHQSNRPWHTRKPFTNFTGGDLDAAEHAVSETFRGLSVSDDSGVAWKVLTNKQAGTDNVIGILAWANEEIASGNKRLAQLVCKTAGAINSSAIEIWLMNAGVEFLTAGFDRFGNFNLPGLMPRGEGSVIASASTIAPTAPVHIVSGTTTINNITVPNIPAGLSVQHLFIPSGAWSYTNAGNIGGVSGTAVVGQPILTTWIPSLSKWSLVNVASTVNLSIPGSLGLDEAKMVRFFNPATGSRASYLRHEIDTATLGGHLLIADVEPISGQDSAVEVQAHAPTGQAAEIHLRTFINSVQKTGLLIDDEGVRIATTNGVFGPPKMTTTQKNALSPLAGDVVYDSTLDKLQVFSGGVWVSLH